MKEPSSLGRHVCRDCQTRPGALHEQVINFDFKSLTFTGAMAAASVIYPTSTQDGTESSSWAAVKIHELPTNSPSLGTLVAAVVTACGPPLPPTLTRSC